MARRGDNIHKRKDGRWEGRFKNGVKSDGTVKYSSVYATTYTECKAKLTDAKSGANIIKMHHSEMRFSDVLYRWFYANQVRLKGATEAKYLNMINKHIIPELGGIKASELDATTVNLFLEKKLQTGGIKNKEALSPSYVRTMAIIVEASINFAVLEGLCSALKTPINKPSILKKELVVLSESEESLLTNVLVNEGSKAAIGTLLALQAGLRIGEVCALRWCDINFESNVIHIRHTVSRVAAHNNMQKTVLILDHPKTESSRRDIPMPTPLRNVLWTAYSQAKSEFVVSDTTSFVGTRTFDYQYKKLLKQNNMSVVNFHTLRHTYATRCAESGMDVKTLSRLLGHSSTTTTLNTYVHPSMEVAMHQVEHIYSYA